MKKELAAKISSILSEAVKKNKITGASVSIVSGDGPAYSEGFGFADVKNSVPAGTDTIFKIGSITKVFTASALMLFAEAGKVNIDGPVTDYIPEFSVKSRFPDARPITVRDLLCHHSGLPCDDMRNYFSDDPSAFKNCVDYLKEAYAPYPPGKMFYYSNLGYDLLGVIIERLSGMPFYKYMEEAVLGRLGMKSSGIVLDEQLKKRVSKPYASGKEQVERLMKDIPPGGIFSNAPDMALFMNAALSNGTGLFNNQDTAGKMFNVQYPGNPYDFNYNSCLGWFSGKPGLDHAGPVYRHDGGTPNFFSLVVLVPKYRLGITLLTNCAAGALFNHTISVEILSLILESEYSLKPEPDAGRNSIPLTSSMAEKTSGRFMTLSGITEIRRSSGRLLARLPQGTFIMTPNADGWFSLAFLLFGIFPLKLKQLSILRLGVVCINNERILAVEQVGFRSATGKEFRPLNSPAEWEKLSGAYSCVNDPSPRIAAFVLKRSPEGMVILIEGGKMGKLKLYLDALSSVEAVIIGMGRYSGETVKAQGESIFILGLEFRKTV